MTDVRTMTTSELVIRICDSAIDYDREKMIYELDRRIPVPNAPKNLDGWQPIETAPKDRAVLIWCKGWQVPAIAWLEDNFWSTSSGRLERPQMWMPLPEVPR